MLNLSQNHITHCVLPSHVTVSTVTWHLADRITSLLSLKTAPHLLKSWKKSPQLQLFSYS